MLPNRETYWIEIDRSTEKHAQLRAKFQNYKNYLSYINENNLPIPFKGILFITDAKQQVYGLKRRWTNILSAFLKETYQYQSDVRLLLAPLNKVNETLDFEINRTNLNQSANLLVDEKLKQDGYEKIIPYIKTSDKTLSYAIAINQTSYKVFFLNVTNAFDSYLYTRFHQFIKEHNTIYLKNEVKHLKQQGFEQLIFHTNEHFFLTNLQGDYAVPEIEESLSMLYKNVEIIKLAIPAE